MPRFLIALRAALACVLGTLSVLPALAQHAAKAETRLYRAGAITIETPWSRATPGGAKVAGGYMKITNNGSAPDHLVGGSVPFAGGFEVHEITLTDGVMKMRRLANGIEIAPGAVVEFKPGGYHVMFVELKSGLKEGQTVKGTLTFEKAGTVAVEYRVAPLGASSHDGAGSHGGGHGDAKKPAAKHGH